MVLPAFVCGSFAAKRVTGGWVPTDRGGRRARSATARQQVRCSAGASKTSAATGQGSSGGSGGGVAGGPDAVEMSDRVREFVGRVEEGDSVRALQRAEMGWQRLKALKAGKNGGRGGGSPQRRVVIERKRSKSVGSPEVDVVVCGGTLGVFLALALEKRGFRTAVVERGKLAGRDQEWNVSRKELEVLLKMGLLTREELEGIIVTEYNPARVQFRGMKEILVNDILNCGVSPRLLLSFARRRYVEELGGTLLEEHDFEKALVGDDGVSVTLRKREGSTGSLGAGGSGDAGSVTSVTKTIRSRLLVDAMGNFSPIVAQLRHGQAPDGVCVVVGSCSRAAWPDNEGGDLLYSFTPIEDGHQYFWEAFPANTNVTSGKSDLRTTYMFSYLDAENDRPSLPDFYDAYLRWLPEYQGVPVKDMKPVRSMSAAFPTYRNSPLHSKIDRLLLFGDSSGIQSPLSFGGLGAMLRHLERIVDATSDALEADQLDEEALKWIMPYLPSLSVTWLFQRAMSVGVNQKVPDAELINKTLTSNFNAMSQMGDQVLRPFLQDVVQLNGLTSLIFMMFADPILVLQLMRHVGPTPFADWFRHYLALAAYDVGFRISDALPSSAPATTSPVTKASYYQKRLVDAFRFGAGLDYHD